MEIPDKMMWKLNRAAITIIVLFSPAGAAPSEVLSGRALKGSYRLYSGPARPVNQVAVLASLEPDHKYRFDRYRCYVKLQSIDGVPGPIRKPPAFRMPPESIQSYGHFYSGCFEIEIPPGPHTLVFTYYSNIQQSSGGSRGLIVTTMREERVVLFVAAPGKYYVADALKEDAWPPKIKELGAIPADYQRPAPSCAIFPKNGSGCLPKQEPPQVSGTPAAKPATSAESTPRTPAAIAVRAEIPIGSASFTIGGGDVREIFAARELLERCGKGLSLLEEGGRREFLARYSRERGEHPELGKLTISSSQIQLPDAGAAAAGPSPAPAGREPSAPAPRIAAMAADISRLLLNEAALSDWVGKNLDASSAASVAEAYVLALCERFSGRLKEGENVQEIRSPNPPLSRADSKDTRKGAKSQRPATAQGVVLGGGQFRVADGQEYASCILRADKEVYAAVRSSNGAVQSFSLKVVEIGQNSAAARAGTNLEGVIHMIEVAPEPDDQVSGELVTRALWLGLFEVTPWPMKSSGWSMTRFSASPGWITSPPGGRVANVEHAPAGGYVVTDRAGKVKAVFGPDFVASLAHSLKGFRDQSGTMFSLPMTAYTYQGKDAKYYSLAVADNGQIVMSGVWSSGAERIAGNFTNPALFRVLSTDK